MSSIRLVFINTTIYKVREYLALACMVAILRELEHAHPRVGFAR